MKRIILLLLPLCFVLTTMQSIDAFAEAPVVDDSENYALLEEQQATNQLPAAQESSEPTYDDTQPALAKESNDNPISSNSNTADLINKLNGLQQDVQELRGQLEVQAHELKQLQEQQLSFYKDLDARLRGTPLKAAKNQAPTELNNISAQQPASPTQPAASSTTIAPTIQPVAAAGNGAHNPADEQISYLAAYELVKSKRYEDAITAMQAFTTKYPQGGYTANAQYWLGELFLVKKNYEDAIAHFDVVLKQFPTSSKYSASLLKMGYALADSGRTAEAKERLNDVLKKYPDTSVAELAHLKLETLGG